MRYIDEKAGRARLLAEMQGLRARMEAARLPPAAGPIPVAPARGAVAVVPEYESTRGGMRRLVGQHAEVLSPLAAVVAAARKRWDAGGREAAFLPPFSPAQVATAELYAALVERCAASGLRMVDLDRAAGGDAAGAVDAALARSRRLERMRAAIDGLAVMEPRRHTDRDNARRTILARVLVDLACVDGWDLGRILRRHGWEPKGALRRLLRIALAEALDRMEGT